eukprot:5038389-Heterocapsa_arctica.AAC.1
METGRAHGVSRPNGVVCPPLRYWSNIRFKQTGFPPRLQINCRLLGTQPLSVCLAVHTRGHITTNFSELLDLCRCPGSTFVEAPGNQMESEPEKGPGPGPNNIYI